MIELRAVLLQGQHSAPGEYWVWRGSTPGISVYRTQGLSSTAAPPKFPSAQVWSEIKVNYLLTLLKPTPQRGQNPLRAPLWTIAPSFSSLPPISKSVLLIVSMATLSSTSIASLISLPHGTTIMVYFQLKPAATTTTFQLAVIVVTLLLLQHLTISLL